MLVGETFTDHPQSVSRTLSAFLRTYNDMLDDGRRQDLYEYAATAVGTAAGEYLENARARRLIQWADERWERRVRWSPLARLQRRAARKLLRDDCESAARYAIKSLGNISADTHAAVLRLVDELITLKVRRESVNGARPRVPATRGDRPCASLPPLTSSSSLSRTPATTGMSAGWRSSTRRARRAGS